MYSLIFQFTAQAAIKAEQNSDASFSHSLGIAQLAVSVVGLLAVGGFAIGLQYRQRATSKFVTSLVTASELCLLGVKRYYPRQSTEQLDIFGANKSIVIVGGNRSGKTTFISRKIMHDMFPWWYRIFVIPRGIYLKGSRESDTAKEWLSSQLATDDKERPMASLLDLIGIRQRQQRIRIFLQESFGDYLPRPLRPQPAIIIVDQAEELLRAYRCDFLEQFYLLAKEARDLNSHRLVLIINTENAVNALKLLNGGNLFEFVQAPMVLKDAVMKEYDGTFVEVFEDCESCIGTALDYVTNKPQMSAKDYYKMTKATYEKVNCLLDPITVEEYTAFVDKRKKMQMKKYPISLNKNVKY